MFLCLVFLMLSSLIIAASMLLLVMFIVILLLSHVVSWVRCGTRLYCFLIFAVFLTLHMFSQSFLNNIFIRFVSKK